MCRTEIDQAGRRRKLKVHPRRYLELAFHDLTGLFISSFHHLFGAFFLPELTWTDLSRLCILSLICQRDWFFSVETHSSWQGARCQHSLQIWIFRHAGRIHSSGLQDFSARSWFGQYLPDVLHIGTGRFSWDPVCFGTVADAKAAKTLRRRRRKDAVHAADATTLRR